jgi:predicted dinucleotide-binding enzyme
MNLAIIGAGSLGTALGERLGQAGHAIMFAGGTSPRDAAITDAGALAGRVGWSCVNAHATRTKSAGKESSCSASTRST